MSGTGPVTPLYPRMINLYSGAIALGNWGQCCWRAKGETYKREIKKIKSSPDPRRTQSITHWQVNVVPMCLHTRCPLCHGGQLVSAQMDKWIIVYLQQINIYTTTKAAIALIEMCWRSSETRGDSNWWEMRCWCWDLFVISHRGGTRLKRFSFPGNISSRSACVVASPAKTYMNYIPEKCWRSIISVSRLHACNYIGWGWAEPAQQHLLLLTLIRVCDDVRRSLDVNNKYLSIVRLIL